MIDSSMQKRRETSGPLCYVSDGRCVARATTHSAFGVIMCASRWVGVMEVRKMPMDNLAAWKLELEQTSSTGYIQGFLSSEKDIGRGWGAEPASGREFTKWMCFVSMFSSYHGISLVLKQIRNLITCWKICGYQVNDYATLRCHNFFHRSTSWQACSLPCLKHVYRCYNWAKTLDMIIASVKGCTVIKINIPLVVHRDVELILASLPGLCSAFCRL